MPQITINFALPDFTGIFTWEGEASEAARTVAAVERMAHRQKLSFRAFTINTLVHAPSLLRGNERVQETTMMAIIAFVLRQPSGSAGHPGLVGDYVDVADFEITFSSVVGQRISYKLRASPTGELAGSA
jgi:hypothetical protein